jgi:hypothetical protein
VARIFPAELDRLVDATEDRLGSFGGGPGIGIGFPQAFQEIGNAGLAAGKDLEAGSAGGVPLLVAEAVEVGGRPSVATAPNSSQALMAAWWVKS